MDGSISFPWYSEREYIEFIIKTLKHADVMLMALSRLDFLSLVCGSDPHMPAASVLFSGRMTQDLFWRGSTKVIVCFAWNCSQVWCLQTKRSTWILAIYKVTAGRKSSNYDQYSSQKLALSVTLTLTVFSYRRSDPCLRSRKLYLHFLSTLTPTTSDLVETSSEERKMEGKF